MSTRKKYKDEGEASPQSRGKIEYPSVSEEERRLAWEAIQKLWVQGGFRSDGPYPKRDELYNDMTSEHVR